MLILDEPANGLDPEGIRWMRELLREHADRGGTVLLSSHLLSEVEHTVDRLLVIGAGRVVADGTDRGAAGRRRRAGPRGGRRRAGRDAAAAGLSVSAEGPVADRGRRDRRAGRPDRRRRNGHVLTDLRPADRGLEDLFFQLTA